MYLKFLTVNNTVDRTAYIRVVDENSQTYDVHITPDQILLILARISSVIWNDYKLVPRD